MGDYIRREDALDIIKRTSGDYAAAFCEVGRLPAADVREAVRCRDCEHWLPRQGCSGCHLRNGMWQPQEDDYCSHWERAKKREGE